MPDKDQQFLEIDAYVRYKITDPQRFLLTLRDELTAQSRIGNIVISEIRRVVAANEQTTIIGGVPEKQLDGTTLVKPKKTETDVATREFITREVLIGANAAVKSNENNQKKAVYKTNYPTKGVNFGVGMNWIFYKCLSSGIYLVRIISEEPSFTYELEEDWECSSSCRSNYESTVKKYTPNNSFYINFGYSF